MRRGAPARGSSGTHDAYPGMTCGLGAYFIMISLHKTHQRVADSGRIDPLCPGVAADVPPTRFAVKPRYPLHVERVSLSFFQLEACTLPKRRLSCFVHNAMRLLLRS